MREPAGFRGRCFACEPTTSGAEFVRVVDEGGRRFTLIPKAAADLRFEGQTVTLVRNERGRLVREPGLGRSR